MWRTVELGDVCEFVRGLTYSKSDEITSTDGTAVLRATNIDLDNHKINLDEIRYISSKVLVKQEKFAKSGDLLICTASGSKSHLGKVALVETDLGMAFGGFMASLRCDEQCIPKFLFFVLTSRFFKSHLASLSNGSNINNLKFSQIQQFQFPLPPLAEQQRIVEKLDKAFAEIDAAIEIEQSNVSSLAALRENILISKFSVLDKECIQLHLAEACADFSRGKSKHRPRNDEKLYGKVIPFIQTGDVTIAVKYLRNYTKMYGEYGIQQSKVWRQGTVCITIAANIAELAILDMDACFPDSVIGALPNENITTSEYLFYLLSYYQKNIKKKGKGSAQQNINLATFAKEKFPFPPLDRQKRIVNELVDIEAHITTCITKKQIKVNTLGAFKLSILKQVLQPQQ